jgi:hypothetical protein
MAQADHELRQHVAAVHGAVQGRVAGAEVAVGLMLSAVLAARAPGAFDQHLARIAADGLRLRETVTRLRVDLATAEAAVADAQTDAQAILATDLLSIVGHAGIAAAAAAGRLQRRLPPQRAEPANPDGAGPAPAGAGLLAQLDRRLLDLQAIIAEHRVDGAPGYGPSSRSL